VGAVNLRNIDDPGIIANPPIRLLDGAFSWKILSEAPQPHLLRSPRSKVDGELKLHPPVTTLIHHMKIQSPVYVLAILLLFTLGSVSAAEPRKEPERQKVLGIGGLFFKSENPAALAKWYETYLGISLVPTGRGQKAWQQEAGPTAFAPFAKNTKYFGKPEQSWMVNFRVADLKAMVIQLRAAGIPVEDPKSYPNGDFARLNDPEGNPIELWEPKESE
jgi:predicted enzyme related to lactoylglutathione lyase